MKKRLLSILLCMALVIGVLPIGALTAFATAPEVKEMTDIVTRVTASGDVWVTFGGVPTATEYTIYCGEGWARTIYVTDESKNEGTFTEFFARAEFYELGSGESRCQSYRARVYAENFYGEKIAEGYSDNFKGPYDKFIGVPRRVYLSSTGILIFEPVEEAATYSVSCYYNGKYLKGNNRVVQNWFDIGDIAREGDYYKFYITAWPKNTNKHLPSRMETSIKYTAEKELAGEVYVNDDRSLTYDWYLGYLDKHTDTALNVQWQKSLNEGEDVEWVDISESEKNSVPVYDLRVKVTAANHNGEVLSSHNSYTDPDHPYFATDYAGLRAVFNQHRDKGKTAYIVLMNDIEGSKTALATNEGNVDLDLNGYTLSYKGTSYSFIRTGNDSYKDLDSNVTIRDTKGTGRIEYQCTQMQYHYSRSTSWHYSDDYLEYAGCNTTVLTGNITVYGGTIVNNSHILFYSYPARESDNLREKVYAPRLGYNYGDGLKMYGGTFEAYKPVIIEAAQTDKEFGLYGGTLRATGPVAVEIQFGKNADADYMYFPQIRNCEIINASGNSQAVAMVAGYNYTYDDITGAIAYKDFGKLFMPETKAYIDGVEQSAVTNGTVYDGKYDIQGPIYSQKYELKTEIQLSKLEFNITEPAVGEFPDYTVTGGDDRLYDVDLYWYQETTPDNFAEMDSGHMFHSGIWYEAMMILRPKDGVDLSIIGNVTVGNKQANRYGNMFILYYYINDDFFDIYVGSTRVGRKSKGDVLGDGGSVQIYEPGEYQLSEDDINYGLKASEFAGRPVLVLNNFTLDHDEYRSDTPNPAQIYLGENVNVLIQGENSLYHMSDADGIIVGSERNVRFFGDGSLTADLDQCDQNALSGWGAKVCFNEAVKVTLRGTYGINLTSGMDPGEDTLVSVENDVILTCGSYVTGITAEHPEPRYGKGLYCDCLYLQDGGAIVCDSDLYCDAMYTGGTTFRNDGYDIRVLKLGEYGKPPYEPGEGVNVGGEDEGNYHYISIYPRQTNINFFKVKIPEARAGKSITYEASVLAGRGYKVEEYDSTTWKDGVLWKKGGTELNPDEDNVFIAGETYTVEVSLVPTDARYAFADFGSGVAASVNGKFVGVNTYYYNDSNYSVKYTFTVGEAEISNINLTVDEPVTGDYLPYYAAVPENADYAIYEDYALGTSNFSGGVAWCEDSYDIAVGDNMFAAGKIYDVFIAVKSKDPDGCPFVAKDDITVTVNGMPAEISLYGDGWCVVHYTFQAKGKNVIDSVAVNIDVPVVGEKPSYVATVSPMVGYMVEPFDNSYYKVGVAWSIGEDFIAPDSNYTFKPGKIYTANIMLCIIDADNNEFADKTLLPATVNGKYTAATKQGSNSYLVKYDFIMPEGDHIPGDINGDGEVDNKDLTRLFQYLSNWDVAVVEPALDVNGDNSVDNKDLTRLFQYLSNWDVEIC